jgi:hypothetical protein
MIRYGSSGVSARIAAVERIVELNDDVGDPEQLEDEIVRGATEP